MLCGLQASNGMLCVDLSGNDNGGLVTGRLCSASDVKVTYLLAFLVISVINFVIIIVTSSIDSQLY